MLLSSGITLARYTGSSDHVSLVIVQKIQKLKDMTHNLSSFSLCVFMYMCVLVLFYGYISGEGVLFSRFVDTAPDKWSGECRMLQTKR